MANVRIRKRQLEWWRESNEEPDGERLTEAYRGAAGTDKKTFGPAWNGQDAPSVAEMGSGYASDADGSKGGLGKGVKTKKNSKSGMKSKDVVEAKRTTNSNRVKEEEEFEDDSLLNEPIEDEGDINPDSEVPPEMEGDEIEGEEAEETAENITVVIDGQEYDLVPKAPSEEGMEGDEMEMDGEEVPSDEAIDNGGVAAEEDDVSKFEARKSVKRAIREMEGTDGVPTGDETMDATLDAAVAESNKKENRQRKIKDALALKAKAEKVLTELFTGEYVMDKQGYSGKNPVGEGDKTFAVAKRASDGEQYTVTASKGDQEPTEKGGSTTHMTTPKGQKEAIQRKIAFKKWLETQIKKFDETDEDPGQDSVEFNQNQNIRDFDADFPGEPEKKGANPDMVSKYESIKKERQLRREGKVAPVEKTKMEESFDFKKLIKGEY